MDTPVIRARAKDSVDNLDNLTAYLDPGTRSEVAQYVLDTFKEIEDVMVDAANSDIDPLAAYHAFVTKFQEYWNAPTA